MRSTLLRFLALALCLTVGIGSFDEAEAKARRKSGTAQRQTSAKAVRTAKKRVAVQQNTRHAALVMDADSGEILFEDHAREARYPASLTKMMTLYMLFDQLKSGRVKLSDKFTASAKAAGMPKTNISLRPGDAVTVEQIVKALVVVSANDAAVVAAEAIGGSEWNFGVMMTNKAAAIGMKDTVFRNANGLPDTRQHTTAYDMAVLGRALRKDFPQYYKYFATRTFDYKGRVYRGHNRVLDRLEGVDGIKTGFINASGFNLVSSLKQNGVSLVAVVMGGPSWSSRDNEMVQLLRQHYTLVAERHHSPQRFAKDAQPQPSVVATVDDAKVKPPLRPTVAVAAIEPAKIDKVVEMAPTAATPIPGTMFTVKEPVAMVAAPEPAKPAAPRFIVSLSPSAPVAPTTRPSVNPATQAAVTPSSVEPKLARVAIKLRDATTVKNSAPQTLDYQMAMLGTSANDGPVFPANGRDWGIQVGAFRSPAQAKEAVDSAVGSVSELRSGQPSITNEGSSDSPIHRARLANLTRGEAEAACRKLNALNSACFPLHIN